MADEFRHELLQTSNIVQSDTQDRNCIICYQETGKISRETGLFELQIRLPCGHVVGSGCIVVWLKDNNSCPLCRREFFPAQPGPSLEDIEEEEDQEEEQEYEDEEENEERLRMLETNCQSFCLQLDLDRRTIRIAQLLIQNLLQLYPFFQAVSNVYDNNAVRLIALAIYIASCLTGHPRSPREIVRVEDVNGHRIQDSCVINGDHIRNLYCSIYSVREELIGDLIMESLEGLDVVWPSISLYDGSNDQIECHRDLLIVRDHCVSECTRLQVPAPINDLAQHISANVVRAGFHAFSHPENSWHLSVSEITAVGIYIASHLVEQPLSRIVVQGLIRDAYPDIRSTCLMVLDKCDRLLVRDDFRESLGVQLNWETLEADVDKESDDGSRHEDIDEEDAAQGQATPDVSAPVARTPRLMNLCNYCCNRLAFGSLHPTTILAQGLSERFSSCPSVADRCLKSIAAACVYIACVSTNHIISYANLVAIMGVHIASIHTTHMIMAQEIIEERIDVQDIARSLNVELPP